MAITAGGFSAFNRVTRRQVDLCAYALMAMGTRRYLLSAVQYRIVTDVIAMTTGTAQAFAIMMGALPLNTLILVAAQAAAVLLGNG